MSFGWVTQSRRLKSYRWLDRYQPWTMSPVSFLEIQLLAESGRLDIQAEELAKEVGRDPRFVIDEVAVVSLIHHALPLAWTRDPFDRLLAAHSLARRYRICSVDATILANHLLVVPELRD